MPCERRTHCPRSARVLQRLKTLSQRPTLLDSGVTRNRRQRHDEFVLHKLDRLKSIAGQFNRLIALRNPLRSRAACYRHERNLPGNPASYRFQTTLTLEFETRNLF